MRVVVVDREQQSRDWGRNIVYRVPLKTVDIDDDCPACGGPRGERRWHRFYEGGDWYSVNVWDNPCGHRDQYSDVLREAAS